MHTISDKGRQGNGKERGSVANNGMPKERTRMMMDQLAAAAMEDEAHYGYHAGSRQSNPTWQETFRQLHDFHKLGNANKSLPPRLIKWMDAQRRRYKLYGVGRKKSVGIIKHRIAQLNSVGFDWYYGEEKREPDHDPRPTVILPLSQRPMRSSFTLERISVEAPPAVEESNRRTKKKTTPKPPRSRSPAAGGNKEIPMHNLDRQKLLNAGFPEQLFHMVNGASERARHLLHWNADGTAFTITDTKNVGNFIRQYFRHSNLSSLRRMLHLYSFSTANNVYRHPHFRRDSSLAHIKRHVVTSASKNENSSTDEIIPIRRNNKDRESVSSRGDNVTAEEDDKKSIHTTGFPEQLYHFVHDGSKTHPHILSWVPEGDAFQIHDTKNAGSFIRQYFRHGKVSSLRRMLHMYQFQTANNVFRHTYFRRDTSLADIKRYLAKKA